MIYQHLNQLLTVEKNVEKKKKSGFCFKVEITRISWVEEDKGTVFSKSDILN